MRPLLLSKIITAFLSTSAVAQVDAHLLEAFTYRNLGPFRMGARVADIAVPTRPAKEHLYTFYVAFWTGGLWKTTNNGTTFDPVFDNQGKFAIGDVTVAPSNANIVWVGTGDAFTSRSSYAGDGVYKSTDGAKTWTNMGLHDSHHIARILVHPSNPDIVYVAAMGHLYSDNAERGVFRTTNGGRTWEKVLYVNERVGVIDLVMDPRNPSALYAATYEKQRLPWQMVNGGPGSGIYKTTNGGQSWTKLTGGLPGGRIGRIGLDIHLANPDILYAVIENENPRTVPIAPPPGARGGGGGGASQRSTIGGEVYRTMNAGRTWTRMTAADYDVSPKGAYYFSQIRVNPANAGEIFVTQDGLRHSLDGGKTWDAPRMFPRMFGDVRTFWIDPENPLRQIQGSDGGVAISYDGGKTSDAYANIPVGEIYTIGIDMDDPYNIYAGLQDHEHWKGPTATALNRVTVNDWLALGDGDGIVTQVDQNDSRWLYTTREYGGHTRVEQKAGYETNIQPQRAGGQPPHRWLWEPPLLISSHNSSVIYAGSQVLLRSDDRGDHWTEISPDLSTNPAEKIMRESEGSVPGGIPWFAISSISESPMTAGLIWAGTSDGKVHVTRDGGKTWTDRTAAITKAGGREDAYVSRVRGSAFVEGRAYVAKSGYKFDDFRPYLYKTEDFGATWTSIASNLPNEPINVVYEDPRNPNLIFVGNDAGVYVSFDRGGRWVRMNNNMPSVPVRDILVHPRERDLVLGTYARGFWITNIGALEELSDTVVGKQAHLFSIKPTVQRVTWVFGANDYLFGQRHLSTPNEQSGMLIRYYLKSASRDSVSIAVADSTGEEVARLKGPSTAGINTAVWSTRRAFGGRGGGPGAAGGGGRGGATVIEQLMPLGRYTVTLDVGGAKLSQQAEIVKTQGWPLGAVPETIRKR
jgi:photosystem II stability/assembly factor-like uncharacterized protein